jgi:hypothetical protein
VCTVTLVSLKYCFSAKFLQDPGISSDSEEKQGIEKASKWLANRLSAYLKAKGPIQWLLVRHKFFFIIVVIKLSNLAVVVLVMYASEQVTE